VSRRYRQQPRIRPEINVIRQCCIMTDTKSFFMRIRTFLFEPDLFFRELAEKPPQYSGPLVIVLVAGLGAMLSAWLITSWMALY
jgi:hypothetical protein